MDVEILTLNELCKLEQYAIIQYGRNNPTIKAVNEVNPITQEQIVKLGNIKDDLDLISTISHEQIHETLKELFDKSTSHKLDEFFYFIGYYKGFWMDNFNILKELFTFEGTTFI